MIWDEDCSSLEEDYSNFIAYSNYLGCHLGRDTNSYDDGLGESIGSTTERTASLKTTPY